MSTNSHPRNAAGPQSAASVSVWRLRPHDRAEINRCAARMRRTLMEVVGPEARQMYSPDWLRNRVKFHLEGDKSLGAVWVAIPTGRKSVGHAIARLEVDAGPGLLGLLSTIYVSKHWRRLGLASRLLSCAEAWLLSQGAERLATDTAEGNSPLIELLKLRGYRIVYRSKEKRMVRLERTAADTKVPGDT